MSAVERQAAPHEARSFRIETERLTLIPCSVDAGRAALVGAAALQAHLGLAVSEELAASQIADILPLHLERSAADASSLPWGVWLMIERHEQALVGDLGFHDRPDAGGVVEIGYEVLPSFRGRGYAREATAALVAWAFDRPEVTAIVAECDAGNAASMRVLSRLGMRRVGRAGNVVRWRITREAHAARAAALARDGDA